MELEKNPPLGAISAPPEGLPPARLFDERVDDHNERFRRLEDAVQSVRNDLDTIMPVREEMITNKAEPAAEKKAVAAPLPAVPAIGDVVAVRIADHPDKTRVVLDMTAAPGATARIEDDGKMLVIPLSNMNWPGKKSWEAESAQLVSGYHLEEGILYMEMMYAAQIKAVDTLLPGAGNKKYRLVIDLSSPEVHK